MTFTLGVGEQRHRPGWDVDEVDAIGHRPIGGQRRQQRPGRHPHRPVLDPHQHHRGHPRPVGVVVLTGVLEDLLDRPGRTRQEHDATVGAASSVASRTEFWRNLAIRSANVFGGSCP